MQSENSQPTCNDDRCVSSKYGLTMLFIQFFQVAAQVLALEVMVDACICFLDLFERPAMQAVACALSDAAKRRILVEEKVQAFNLYQTKERAAGRSRRSKKQSKAVRASTGGERSETPPAAALKVPAAKQHPAAIAKREAEREAAQEARQAERQARLEAAAAAAKHEAAEAAARLEAAEAERSECEQAVLWLCSRPDPAAAAQAFNMYNAAARAARVARAARATHAARAARAALTVEVTEVQAGQAEEEEAAFKECDSLTSQWLCVWTGGSLALAHVADLRIFTVVTRKGYTSPY